MIKAVEISDIPECAAVIRSSFRTVADEFGFTPANAHMFTAFAVNEDRLYHQLNAEKRPMYKYTEKGRIAGYYSLVIKDEECELNNLCVLPEVRHHGIGRALLEDSFGRATDAGCSVMKLGIVEENSMLKRWYEGFGFKHTGCEKYDLFPFTCGYMERDL